MSEKLPGPAYRVQTPRLVIRCWMPEDAPRLKAAVEQSLDHLLPWMPWAHQEPTGLQAKVDFLRRVRGQFDLNQDYTYGIFNRAETEVLGGTGLHTRLEGAAREIGYWIHQAHIKQGLATETAAALTKVAFLVDGVNRVEIHCDPQNFASAAVPGKLGYQHEATLRRRTTVPGSGKRRDTMVWTLFAADFPASPAASLEIEAFDVIGRKLL
jgi:RimJ/RimL family protein N-acetyltransferase